MYQTQKTQEDEISITATPTNLNPPVLSTVSEIPRAVHLVLQINTGNLTIPIPAKQQIQYHTINKLVFKNIHAHF